MLMFQIVDSVIALFRVDFTGRGELADLQVSFIGSLQCLYLLISYVLPLYPSLFFMIRANCYLQQNLAQMLSRLIKIAEEFNVAVYMTNQGKH